MTMFEDVNQEIDEKHIEWFQSPNPQSFQASMQVKMITLELGNAGFWKLVPGSVLIISLHAK
jgi:hypothetical protein